jgi:hypothetical protein
MISMVYFRKTIISIFSSAIFIIRNITQAEVRMRWYPVMNGTIKFTFSIGQAASLDFGPRELIFFWWTASWLNVCFILWLTVSERPRPWKENSEIQYREHVVMFFLLRWSIYLCVFKRAECKQQSFSFFAFVPAVFDLFTRKSRKIYLKLQKIHYWYSFLQHNTFNRPRCSFAANTNMSALLNQCLAVEPEDSILLIP